MNGGSIHTCTSVEADLAVELPYSQRVASVKSLLYVGARVRVEERRLKTEADLNSANPSLFTELPFTRCGKGLRLASA